MYFVHSSGGYKSKIKVSTGLVLSEVHKGQVYSKPLFLACRLLSSYCVFTLSFSVQGRVEISSSKGTNHMGLGVPELLHFNLISAAK